MTVTTTSLSSVKEGVSSKARELIDDFDATQEEISDDEDNSEEEDSEEDSSDAESEGNDDSDASENSESDEFFTGENDGIEKKDMAKLKTIQKLESLDSRRRKNDEFDYDSSDEEDIRNTIGNVPLQWYKHHNHIGYDWDGKKILKPASGDTIDEFLSRKDDKNYWRSVRDPQTGQMVVLSDKDLAIAKSLKGRAYPEDMPDPYAPWPDTFSSEVNIHPVGNEPPHKRSFLPSANDRRIVSRFLDSMNRGHMKPIDSDEETPPEYSDDEPDPEFGLIWGDDEQNSVLKSHRARIPAPKEALPGHEASYNPPPEYLFTEQEEKNWKNKDPEDRKIDFIPQKYKSLRHIPAYKNFVKERFERCMELVMAPRKQRMRITGLKGASDLLPSLPRPQDLEPYPKEQAIVYKGHTDLVRVISVDISGQWLATCSEDCTVRLWEILTGRCLRTFTFDKPVRCIAWNPNPQLSLLALSLGDDPRVILLNPALGDRVVTQSTQTIMTNALKDLTLAEEKLKVKWRISKALKSGDGEFDFSPANQNDVAHHTIATITHFKPVTSLDWHAKGDYLLVSMSAGESQAVILHRLSQQRSQNPFTKSHGIVQQALFHPFKPQIYVVGHSFIRIYDLVKQKLVKKLQANCKVMSHVSLHPSGSHVMAGSYDCRFCWFDTDFSIRPYKTLRPHTEAIRAMACHRRYPLIASCSDDGVCLVSHCEVFPDDYSRDPVLVPVRRLRGHQPTSSLNVTFCLFHPTQPWVFTAGADSTVRLYT